MAGGRAAAQPVTAPEPDREDAPADPAPGAAQPDAPPPAAEPPAAPPGADAQPAEAGGPTGAAPPTDAAPGDEPPADDLDEIERALAGDAADTAVGRAPPITSRGAPSALQSATLDISLIMDVAAAYFSDDENLQTGGHDPTETGFNLQGLEMSIGSTVDPYFRFDSNLVFSQFGVELEEAYATSLALPWSLQARLGQFLTRIGRQNPTHLHQWDFVDQPFVLGRLFGGEGNRGLGVETSYLTPLPWYLEIVGSLTDATGEGTARSFFGADDVPVESPLDLQATLVIEQFVALHHNWSLMVGLSGATGPNATGNGTRTDIYSADLYIKYRPITSAGYEEVEIEAEYYYRRRQVPRDLLRDHGAFGQVVWRFGKQWRVGGRYEWGGPARSRHGRVEVDPLDPEWTDDRHRWSAALTFNPTEFSRLRLQGSLDQPTWRPDPIAAVMLAFEFAVGAHGAHTF